MGRSPAPIFPEAGQIHFSTFYVVWHSNMSQKARHPDENEIVGKYESRNNSGFTISCATVGFLHGLAKSRNINILRGTIIFFLTWPGISGGILKLAHYLN